MYDVNGLLMPVDVAHVRAALDHIAGAAYADQTGRAHHTRIADAFVELCQAYNAGTVTGGRERPKVLVTVPFETVVERGAARGVIIGIDATRVRLTRFASCVAMPNSTGSSPAASRRSSITAPPPGWRPTPSTTRWWPATAGCRWPGCDRPPGWCEAHHIDEVIRDDGPTNLPNMVLLCSTHHTLVHQQHWQLHGNADNLHIREPNGNLRPAPCRGPAFGHVPRQLQLVDA